jgi:hypothetical protein
MVFLILIILVIAFGVVNFMLRRDAARREDLHERRRERFTQLMAQLNKRRDDDQEKEEPKPGSQPDDRSS